MIYHFIKTEDTFMMKILNNRGIKWIYLNIIKAICEKPSTNIILNNEKLTGFPLRTEITQECLLISLLLKIVLKDLTTEIRQEKEMKCGKEGKKVTVCRWHDAIYWENPIDSTKTLLELIKKISKFPGCKINIVYIYIIWCISIYQ